MSTHIFYKENLPYKSRISNRKLLQDEKLISVQKVILHLSLLEFIFVFQFSIPYSIHLERILLVREGVSQKLTSFVVKNHGLSCDEFHSYTCEPQPA